MSGTCDKFPDLLAGPVFGLCVLAGVAAGEISVRPTAGRTRTAAVEVRRVRDYLPRGLASAVTDSVFAVRADHPLAEEYGNLWFALQG